MDECIYDAVNKFLKELARATEPLWPSVSVPLPQRRNIGPCTTWPWTSLNTIVHKGQVISTDDIFDVINEIQADLLAQATSDIRLAIMSAKKLSDSILKCQRASAELLRQELNALVLTNGVRANGDDHDLLLPVANRVDKLKYGNWEVRHALHMAKTLVVYLPDDMTLSRIPGKVSVTWRSGSMVFDFDFTDPSPDSWVGVSISDRKGDIDYFGLSGLAQRLATACPDPDSAVALMEALNIILNLLEEA